MMADHQPGENRSVKSYTVNIELPTITCKSFLCACLSLNNDLSQQYTIFRKKELQYLIQIFLNQCRIYAVLILKIK